MTEDGAKAWIADRYGTEKLERLAAYVRLLLAGNASQNLISRATESAIWVRHILDSAQLLRFAPDAGEWLDVGSGPGLPGVVLAILSDRPVLMVEPRRRRVEFLDVAKADLSLDNATIQPSAVEKLSGRKFGAVTARAYAALAQILSSTYPLTVSSTIWVLPKGRSADRELVDVRQSWQGTFHVEQSLTNDEAHIIVATGVKPR
ncbi:MAG: 16S rRNA (guanine(527)-N(7))-methyltransferase RsmG [Proteobacteria bacterium]|nr:16S rRNA (guanine(527)-N(7))-methyltransferase RsmG [Pseudomonadota bacterium]